MYEVGLYIRAKVEILTNIHQQNASDHPTYLYATRKMIRGGFKRIIDDNDEILQICQTKDRTHVSKQQSNNLGHYSRRPNNNNTKRLLFNDNTNRKRGRPVKNLEEHVHEYN